MIYFDNASTEIIDKETLNKFSDLALEFEGNASSKHRLGQINSNALDHEKNNLLDALKLNKNEYEVILTSGATESNNIFIKGVVHQYSQRGKRIISSSIEHPSVLNVMNELKNEGFDVILLDPDESGLVPLSSIIKNINDETILVSLMKINNEIGSNLNEKEIENLVRKFPKCFFYSDVTQGIGKVETNYSCFDGFGFSFHKLGSLFNSGCLIKKKKIILKNLLNGGSQQNGMRPGTIATPNYLLGLSICQQRLKNLNENYKYVKSLNAYFLEKLKNINEVILNSNPSLSSPYIINFSLKTKKASVVLEALSNKEIFVSSTSSCHRKEDGISYVINNIYKDNNRSSNSIRVSFSNKNTIKEIDEFFTQLNLILENIK